MLKIIHRRKIWFVLSLSLVSVSLIVLFLWGIKLGIDFTGGTLMEIGFKEKVLSGQEIETALSDLNLGKINVQFSGEKDVLLRLKDVDEETHQKIIESLEKAASEKKAGDLNNQGKNNKDIDNNNDDNKSGNTPTKESGNTNDNVANSNDVNAELSEQSADKVKNDNLKNNGDKKNTEITSPKSNNDEAQKTKNDEDAKEKDANFNATQEETVKNIEEKRFNSIGPVIGNELKSSAVLAIIIALFAIVFYIGWAFRKISYPVSSIKYGVVAVVALFHDVVITLGVFSILSHFYGVEVGISFVAALLAILGYSVNDTIVIFDRTRENLLKSGIDDFEEVVEKSVNETLIRSFNTSFTTLLVLFSLYLFGGETIKYFIVALIIGISCGTYSSIFIASPLLVSLHKFSLKRKVS